MRHESNAGRSYTPTRHERSLHEDMRRFFDQFVQNGDGQDTSSVVTSQGPMGAKLSWPLPLSHWPPRSICQARSDTSLAST